MNQTTRQRITGSLVLAFAALILLPVIFDGEGSYLPTVEPEIPARPLQPQPAFQDAERPMIDADSDAIRIRPETSGTAETLTADVETAPDTPDSAPQSSSDTSAPAQVTSIEPAPAQPLPDDTAPAQSSAAPATAEPSAPIQPPAPITGADTAQTSTAAPADNRTAALDVQGLPESWSVRLGSFSSAANASALVTRLQDAGHRAYTRRVDSSQGPLTAVFVGPLVDRGAAQILLDRLRQDFQLSGMIVRYEIEQL